ncbi:MAG: precorrin-6y C5,15-methyltransferase (decarboxylating) subunit CbiE [Deltaproteobacteria bacterium]|nr:precorrin-6y C5,15-methyltransferase (decarboxylating) subunit CbiE [Deltaproteobacteria bacterium]
MQSNIHIIGIGVEGRESLSKKAVQLIQSAGLLIGGERHLDEFPEFKGERFVLKANLKEMLEVISSGDSPDSTTSLRFVRKSGTVPSPPVVVLASGDPGLFGIADYLIRNLGRDAVEIIPNLSAMQWAFAKSKVSWNDARIVSSHGRGMDKILQAAKEADTIGIFTGNGDEPSEIAKLLIDNGLNGFTAYIYEDLGMETEKVSERPLSEVIGKRFAALNVMVLLKGTVPDLRTKRSEVVESGLSPKIGIPDSEFAHSKGLITKEEVRAVSLAKLRLRDDSIVWDIGAGSGSVGIEAARLCRNGKVFAIEKEPERAAHIRENIEKFGVNNIEVLEGKAPEGLDGFSDPDAVFIGGSGGNLSDILDVMKIRLRPSGRIVINAITLETLHEATTGLEDRGFDVDVVSLNIARSKDLIGMTMFEAENPVFIITGKIHYPQMAQISQI